MRDLPVLPVDIGKIGEDVAAQFGGFLRCETCRQTKSVQGSYLATGWPKCCGYTMRWWTARQLAAGDVNP